MKNAHIKTIMIQWMLLCCIVSFCRSICRNVTSITNIDRYSSINAPNESKLSHKHLVHFTSRTIILTLWNPDFFLYLTSLNITFWISSDCLRHLSRFSYLSFFQIIHENMGFFNCIGHCLRQTGVPCSFSCWKCEGIPHGRLQQWQYSIMTYLFNILDIYKI